jgi:acyl-CoA dehydrogenase
VSWDFETDSEFQALLDWADGFVRTRVEPLDLVLGSHCDRSNPRDMAVVRPLQQEVRAHGLWATHLEPELGGQGHGQVKLALLNEILGRSRWAPTVFGCQAPDSGNAEILARFGTPDQRERYLQPLLDGEVVSCYSMTEPEAGADPTLFRTTARKVDGGWRIDGEKWFSSNARYAAFLIVMAVTDPDAPRHARMSMFILPRDTPGIEIVRNVPLGGEPPEGGTHAYVRYTDVHIPDSSLLGERGAAFKIAQTRLGGGRVHHAMRTIAQARRAFDMMCERAISRPTRSGVLADLGVVQEQVADSWVAIEQFRLLVLRTAWLIDKHGDYAAVRKDIAAVKAAMPAVLHDVVRRAMHLHGALGLSNEMPFTQLLVQAEVLAVADGPTEVHKVTLARELLKGYEPADPVFPSQHLPTLEAAARKRLAEALELEIASQ